MIYCNKATFLLATFLLSFFIQGSLFSQGHKVNYASYQEILDNYVNANGEVDYMRLKKNEKKLYQVSDQLRLEKVSQLNKEEELAYWINLYNLETLRLIIENFPVESIKSIQNGKVWDIKRIQFIDKTLSLNDIENEILRKKFKDPRIHFVINCAAISCPPLLNQHIASHKLEFQLEERTRLFINDIRYNQMSTKENKISKIFDWYGNDFGNVKDFINRYSKKKIQTDSGIVYLDYDWSLNIRKE